MDEWTKLDELEEYFHSHALPEEPMMLNGWTKILNPMGFVNAHISICRGNFGKDTYLPYMKRLIEFKDLLDELGKKISRPKG